MFTNKEKIALVITGIEIVVIAVSCYAMKKGLADRLGIDIKDLKNVKNINDYRTLKNKGA